jgi:transcriptional antiterminator RfaH
MWFAVNTKPRNEAIAEKNLAAKGIEVFSPRIELTRRRGGRRVAMMEPLFPGYLFVASEDPADLVMQVRYSFGVKRIVSAGNVPLLVPEEAVNLIKWRIGEGGPGVPRVEREFEVGDKVAVRHGPFGGLIGVIDRTMPGKDRVRVLLDFMSRQTPVEMDTVMLDRM